MKDCETTDGTVDGNNIVIVMLGRLCLKPRNSSRNLLENSFSYEVFLNWVARVTAKPELCVDTITLAALHARFYHPGRFADGNLENWALRLGLAGLPKADSSKTTLGLTTRKNSKTLHVVSEVYPIGGHSRVLSKWILRDTSSAHGVVLTQQRGPLPGFFQEAVTQTGGALLCLSSHESAITRASKLRSVAKDFDRVILHTHPNDVLPILAFAPPDLPPVAMFNHAHFSFCLGTTVSDLVVNTQEYYENISREYRYARRTSQLTTVAGLTDLSTGDVDKAAAKRKLGFDSSARLMMTIAYESYFTPAFGYDFFRTASRLLKDIPDVHLIVVGVPSNSSLAHLGSAAVELTNEPRCHFVGAVADPEPYYRAADISLESFPMASSGGFVEAVTYGEAFPIRVYGEGESVLRSRLSPWLDGIERSRNEDEYVDDVARIASHLPSARQRARELRLMMFQYDQTFGERLEQLNRSIDMVPHGPAEIPSSAMIDSSDTRTLADLRPSNLLTTIYKLLPTQSASRNRLLTGVRYLIPPRAAAGLMATGLRRLSSATHSNRMPAKRRDS